MPQSKNGHLIELQQVTKVFRTLAGEFIALKDIDLQVAPNEFVAVIGKSGSGKSTLINMIAGLDQPTLGEVFVDNILVNTVNEDCLTAWRGRNVGVVFQFFQLLPTLTVVENVMLPMEFCNLYSARGRLERALDLLKLVDLSDQTYKLPAHLSGGQQQRVAIARALANDPKLLLADEPTGNIDSHTGEIIFELFGDLVQQGKTVLIVTHDVDLASRVSRVVHLADGQITGGTNPQATISSD